MKRFALVILIVSASAPAAAGPYQTARAFLSNAPKAVHRALYNTPGAKAGLVGLGEVLERGAISRDVLTAVVSNHRATPYLAELFTVLPTVDRVPGVEATLGKLASASIDYVARGYSFEVIAGAGLEKRARTAGERVSGFGQLLNGCEVDVSLANGTMVEVKSLPSARQAELLAACVFRGMAKAERQLIERCAGGAPAMLVIPPVYDNAEKFGKMATAIGTPFTVISVDPETCATRKLFDSSAVANSALRNALRGRLGSAWRVVPGLRSGGGRMLAPGMATPWRTRRGTADGARPSASWR